MARQRCVLSRSPDAQQEALGSHSACVLAFFTASYQHLLWDPNSSGPQGPFGLM